MSLARNFMFLFGTTLVACAANNGTGTTPATDPLAGETNDGEKSDGTGPDTFGIYTALKVGAFECNGQGSCTHVAVARANRTTTTCADGSAHASCDVRYLDFSKLSLSSAQLDAATTQLQLSAEDPSVGAQLLVRGKYIHGTNPLYPNVDWVTFQVTELWTARIDSAPVEGTFVMLQDNGRRCFEPPCAATNEYRINSSRKAAIDGLDWPDAMKDRYGNPTGAVVDAVNAGLAATDGVIVVGDRTQGTIMHLPEQLRSINQAYVRVK